MNSKNRGFFAIFFDFPNMKQISIEVDAKDTKRVNLPVGRVLVSELSALVNGPLVRYKKEADLSLNELACKALDDIIKRIHTNKQEAVAFIEKMRRERYEYATRVAPPLPPVIRKRVAADVIEIDVGGGGGGEECSYTPKNKKKNKMKALAVSIEEFEELLFDLRNAFKFADEEGRRIAYKRLLETKNILEDHYAE